MIAMDLSKQQTIAADPNAIKHINFTGNLVVIIIDCFSLLKKQKKQF